MLIGDDTGPRRAGFMSPLGHVFTTLLHFRDASAAQSRHVYLSLQMALDRVEHVTRASWIGGALIATVAAGANAQSLESGPLKLKLIGRVQSQFSTTSVAEDELLAEGRRPASPIPATLFETRRVRLGAELEFEKWVTGKIEAELAMARLFLRDTWVNLGFTPEFQVRLGQWKKPFSLLQLTSSTKWPIIERGVRIRGLSDRYAADDDQRVLTSFRGRMLFGEEQELLDVQGYQNFDLGAAVHGATGPLTYQVGVFNGAGSDATDDTNGKSLAGRLTARPWKASPLTFGAGLSTREFRLQSAPAIETRGGSALEADVEWGDFRRKGFHLLAEVTRGRNLAVADTMDHENFVGGQAVAAWYAPLEHERIEGWEIAGRVSYGDPRQGLDGDEGTLFTPGLNLYFTGRNRIMFNWDVFKPSGSQFSTEHAFRAQFQVYF